MSFSVMVTLRGISEVIIPIGVHSTPSSIRTASQDVGSPIPPAIGVMSHDVGSPLPPGPSYKQKIINQEAENAIKPFLAFDKNVPIIAEKVAKWTKKK